MTRSPLWVRTLIVIVHTKRFPTVNSHKWHFRFSDTHARKSQGQLTNQRLVKRQRIRGERKCLHSITLAATSIYISLWTWVPHMGAFRSSVVWMQANDDREHGLLIMDQSITGVWAGGHSNRRYNYQHVSSPNPGEQKLYFIILVPVTKK